MRRRPVIAAAVAAAVMVAVLVVFRDEEIRLADPAADSQRAAEALGRCADDFEPDVGAIDVLADAERWLEVAGFTDDGDRGRNEQKTVELTLLARAPGSTSSATPQQVAIWGASIPGIDWALRSGSTAYLALASEGMTREYTMYVLIRHRDGTHFFAGNCEYRHMTRYLRDYLGGRYDETLRAIVGQTDREKMLALIERGRAATASTG